MILRSSHILDLLERRKSDIDRAIFEISGQPARGPVIERGLPDDLPSRYVLGLRHKHGTKMRYLSGCRCSDCRSGNAQYQARLDRNRKLYGPNDLVPATRVLEHLRYLQQFSIGHKTVAKRAQVSKTGLAEIVWYGKKNVRRRTEAKILAIQPTLENMPISEDVPAGESLDRIHRLVRWGYPKVLISRDAMGSVAAGLQIRAVRGDTSKVTVKTALKIRRFFELVVAMRKVWQQDRGPIPPRHYVYWKRLRGRPPTKPNIRRLELRPFARTYEVNFYPRELKEAIALKNRVRKQIGRKGRNG